MIFVATAAVVAAYDYSTRTAASVMRSGRLPGVAVVFTGQFDRIHAGLKLLRQGRIERLFISGVNPPAGIRIAGFADQFGLDAPLRKALSDGRIVLGPRAHNTRQNAVETACWVRARNFRGAILLITSQAHMPRASVALERALPGRRVERLSVPHLDAPANWRVYATEFLKHAAMLIASDWLTRDAMACPSPNTAQTQRPEPRWSKALTP